MSTNECDDTPAKLTRLEKKIESQLDTIKQEVDDLYETVYKGNGHPSLVTRVNSVEGQLRGLREQMDEKIEHLSREHTLKIDGIHQKLENKFGRLEGWIETKFNGIEHMMARQREDNRIDRAGSWQVKATVTAAAIAAVGGIITLFLNWSQ